MKLSTIVGAVLPNLIEMFHFVVEKRVCTKYNWDGGICEINVQ